MSTRMYNYRIAKDQWWPFAVDARNYYLNNHPMVELLKLAATRTAEKTDGLSIYTKIEKIVDTFTGSDDRDWTVDFQLFDEGDTYLVRVLERGYFFMNSFDNFSPVLEQVFYNNSTDVPLEEEKNKAVAEWVDELINAKRYLLYTVLDRRDFMNIAFDALLGKIA